MASWAVRGHKAGPKLKISQKVTRFPSQVRTCLVLSGEVPCVPGAGDKQTAWPRHHLLTPAPFHLPPAPPCPAPALHPPLSSGFGLTHVPMLNWPCHLPAVLCPHLFPHPSLNGTPAYVSHAVEGQWLEWGPWSPCSTSCANGTQQRSRKCSVAGPAWATCLGALTDTRECGNLECPGECSHGWQAGGHAGPGGHRRPLSAPPLP